MITSFHDRETEKVYHQDFSRRLPPEVQKAALRKLIQLDNATCIDDLRQPPANRLETLHGGGREGQLSIRINDQWRLCFVWDAHNCHASRVEITDYH